MARYLTSLKTSERKRELGCRYWLAEIDKTLENKSVVVAAAAVLLIYEQRPFHFPLVFSLSLSVQFEIGGTWSSFLSLFSCVRGLDYYVRALRRCLKKPICF